MAKFELPDGVVKVEKHEAGPTLGTKIFPIGTLYLHIASKTYFRFMTKGGRWDTVFLLTTNHGLFVRDGFAYPIGDQIPVTHPDKNVIVAKLIQFLINRKEHMNVTTVD